MEVSLNCENLVTNHRKVFRIKLLTNDVGDEGQRDEKCENIDLVPG